MTEVLTVQAAAFREAIDAAGIVDAAGVHHEFSQGLHGRKIDFDRIDDSSPLFDQWADLQADYIRANYDPQPDAVVGVANGTNRLARAVGERLGEHVLVLESEKPQPETPPRLTPEATRLITAHHPRFALIQEDVGTTGRNSLSVAISVMTAGLLNVEVLNTVQRSTELTRLDVAGVQYRSIIRYFLPSWPAERCNELPDGYCAQGWKFIPYQR